MWKRIKSSKLWAVIAAVAAVILLIISRRPTSKFEKQNQIEKQAAEKEAQALNKEAESINEVVKDLNEKPVDSSPEPQTMQELRDAYKKL